jgi:hypothetical protein
MPKRVTLAQQSVSITDVAAYHTDADASLRLLFAISNPNFALRFLGYSQSQLFAELAERLNETDLRSSFAILTRLEAAFRLDYKQRRTKKKSDAVSIAFRALHKSRGEYVRLEDDIFVIWREHHPEIGPLISELRGAFKFRHWVAHGKYWHPNLGRKYDYQWIYTLADAVLEKVPLMSE